MPKAVWSVAVALFVALVACGSCLAQGVVPRVTYVDPIAGFTMDIPEDWSVQAAEYGLYIISIDAGSGAGICIRQPVVWFFESAKPPEAAARELAEGLSYAWGSPAEVRATGNGGEWEVTMSTLDELGTLLNRFLFRQERGRNYCVAAFSRPEIAEQFREDLRTVFATCRLVDRPATQIIKEPKYNAYRMTLPVGWRWEGEVIWARLVPGYFTWKVQSPDGSLGAFSSPPALFNVTTPYMPPSQCAQAIVVPGLRQYLPDVRLEDVHELPRFGAYSAGLLKAFGISDSARVDKAWGDFVGTAGGRQVRVRATMASFMIGSSPLLGGRGDWFFVTCGAWAPVEEFAQQYPLCRAVVSSLVTDQQFRINQMAAVTEVILGKDIKNSDGSKRHVRGMADTRDYWSGQWISKYIRR
ncbi:hypothetical protein LLH03_21575 [bacterium]|nr:hypothetical protein [bacterium]